MVVVPMTKRLSIVFLLLSKTISNNDRYDLGRDENSLLIIA